MCCGTWPHNTCQLVHLGPNLPTTDLLKTVHIWPDRTINLDRTMIQIECAVTSYGVSIAASTWKKWGVVSTAK